MPIIDVDVGDIVISDLYPHITGKVVRVTEEYLLVLLPNLFGQTMLGKKNHWSLFEKGNSK